MLLEERAIIKRQEASRSLSQSVKEDVHSYSLQFSPPGAQLDDPMMVQVENSEEEGTTIVQISDAENPVELQDAIIHGTDLVRQSMNSGMTKNSIIVEDEGEYEEASREGSPQ